MDAKTFVALPRQQSLGMHTTYFSRHEAVWPVVHVRQVQSLAVLAEVSVRSRRRNTVCI